MRGAPGPMPVMTDPEAEISYLAWQHCNERLYSKKIGDKESEDQGAEPIMVQSSYATGKSMLARIGRFERFGHWRRN
jgi:hypothetical protein